MINNELKPEKRYLNLEEAAEYLGLSKSTMYKKIHYKEISCYKPNTKKVYFELKDLEKYIQQNYIKSEAEIEIAIEAIK